MTNISSSERAGEAGRTIEELAAELVATKTGIGMTAPFYAETASVKGDESWTFWIVRNANCNSLGVVMPRALAEELREAPGHIDDRRYRILRFPSRAVSRA